MLCSLGTHYVEQDDLEFTESACICLLGAKSKGVHQHIWLVTSVGFNLPRELGGGLSSLLPWWPRNNTPPVPSSCGAQEPWLGLSPSLPIQRNPAPGCLLSKWQSHIMLAASGNWVGPVLVSLEGQPSGISNHPEDQSLCKSGKCFLDQVDGGRRPSLSESGWGWGLNRKERASRAGTHGHLAICSPAADAVCPAASSSCHLLPA